MFSLSNKYTTFVTSVFGVYDNKSKFYDNLRFGQLIKSSDSCARFIYNVNEIFNMLVETRFYLKINKYRMIMIKCSKSKVLNSLNEKYLNEIKGLDVCAKYLHDEFCDRAGNLVIYFNELIRFYETICMMYWNLCIEVCGDPKVDSEILDHVDELLSKSIVDAEWLLSDDYMEDPINE